MNTMSEKHVQKISPWFGAIETVLVFRRVADRFAEQREINSIHESNGHGVKWEKTLSAIFCTEWFLFHSSAGALSANCCRGSVKNRVAISLSIN
jgi:hypothetical protein